MRQAYRRKAFDAHPDRQTDHADVEMAAINEAWRVLGNRELRAAYDRTLGESPAVRPRAPRPDPAPAPPPRSEPLDDSDEPLTSSDRWTRRWTLSVGILTLIGLAFAALLLYIAFLQSA